VGSCGTAAYKGQRIIIEDVFQHPYCRNFVCWQSRLGWRPVGQRPIFSSTQRVLGVFAVYHRAPNYPDTELLTEISELAQLASIAIERKLSEKKVTHLAFLMR